MLDGNLINIFITLSWSNKEFSTYIKIGVY